MNPQVTAAIIAAIVSGLTLIGTLAAQYFGRRATSKQLDRTLAEQRTRTLNERFATAAGQLGDDCRGIRNHAPLARRCRGIRKPGPAPLACADRSWPGSSVVDGWRRAGRKVHSGAGAPPAVTGRLWTVRGRELDCCRSPCRVTPLLLRARVSVACTDPGALAGGAPVPIRRGCRYGRWPGA